MSRSRNSRKGARRRKGSQPPVPKRSRGRGRNEQKKSGACSFCCPEIANRVMRRAEARAEVRQARRGLDAY